MKDEHAKDNAHKDTGPAVRRENRPRQGRTVTFVIVLVLEEQSSATEPDWRWRVRSVETGDERHFRRVADVLAYVAALAGAPAPR